MIEINTDVSRSMKLANQDIDPNRQYLLRIRGSIIFFKNQGGGFVKNQRVYLLRIRGSINFF